MRVSIIAAVAENGVIGRGGKLPWRLSDDLKRFKRLTMGHTIVMGRKTWESIGRPLTGRRMIVVSRQADYRPDVDGVQVASSLDDALQKAAAAGEGEMFVIGGAELYECALPRADRLYLTRVRATVDGDTRFPPLNLSDWQLVDSQCHDQDAANDYHFSCEVYDRK